MPLNLEKESKSMRLSLSKAGVDVTNFSMQVKLVADVSGSFEDEYRANLVNPFFDAAGVIAKAIDPDNKLQVIAFSNKAADTGDYTISESSDLAKEFLKRVPSNVIWGATDYALGMRQLNESVATKPAGLFGGIKNIFGKSAVVADDKPWLVLMVTDGEDGGSASDFKRILKENSEKGIFTVLFGVNSNQGQQFRLLKEASEIDGVTYHRVSDLQGLDSESLYAKIFDNEFVNWYNKQPKKV